MAVQKRKEVDEDGSQSKRSRSDEQILKLDKSGHHRFVDLQWNNLLIVRSTITLLSVEQIIKCDVLCRKRSELSSLHFGAKAVVSAAVSTTCSSS